MNHDDREDILNRKVVWNLPGISEFTFMRTYSRKKENGKLETWNECVVRVIEGMFTILKTYTKLNLIPWNEDKAQRFAKEAADRMFVFKWLPPGRGLWMMGTDFMWEKGSACLQNCGFVSTERMGENVQETVFPFTFLMDMMMVGSGIGFDTKGAGKLDIKGWDESKNEVFVVQDTRESWVESIGKIIEHCIYGKPRIWLDTRLVRSEGQPIRGFGGVSSGPMPLIQSANGIADLLNSRRGKTISSTDIVDVQNLIGKCVVAGNVRRGAEIAFADPEDEEFYTMKNFSSYPVETGAAPPPELMKASKEDYESYLAHMYTPSDGVCKNIVRKYENEIWAYKFGGWRWASNNSMFAKVGMKYDRFENSIRESGEPGFVWMDLIRSHGRLKDEANNADYRVMGTNPCGEQSMESYEMCNLVETFPVYHEDYWDFQRSLKYAFMYSKIVTLMGTHVDRTNAVIIRNRRIGCSMSGVADAIGKFGRSRFLADFCDKAYDYIRYVDCKYSNWLGIRESIKKTTVKPSGTTSIVAGVSGPGMHFAKMKSGYRLIRVANNSDMVSVLKGAGYRVEPSVTDPMRTMVVYFPMLVNSKVLSEEETTIWEKFKMAADLQYYWSDNSVSCTIEFNKKEAENGEIVRCLEAFEGNLKVISLLPKMEGNYAQMPYTAAPREEIEEYIKQLQPLDFSELTNEGEDSGANLYCDSTSCSLK